MEVGTMSNSMGRVVMRWLRLAVAAAAFFCQLHTQGRCMSQEVHRIREGVFMSNTSLACTNDLLAIANRQDQVTVRSLKDFKVVKTYDFKPDQRRVGFIDFDATNGNLVIASYQRFARNGGETKLEWHHLTTGKITTEKTIMGGVHAMSQNRVAVTRAYSIDDNAKINLMAVELDSGKVDTLLQNSDTYPYHVATSPDGNYVAGSWSNWEIALWERKTGWKRHQLKTGGVCQGMSFSSDSRTLFAVAGNNGYVWNAATREKLSEQFTYGASFIMPNGRWCVAWNANDLVLLNLYNEREPVRLRYSEEKWRCDIFRATTDGRYLIGSSGSSTRIWK